MPGFTARLSLASEKLAQDHLLPLRKFVMLGVCRPDEETPIILGDQAVRLYHIVAASVSWWRLAKILHSRGTVDSPFSLPADRRRFLRYYHFGSMMLLLIEDNVEQLLSCPGRWVAGAAVAKSLSPSKR